MTGLVSMITDTAVVLLLVVFTITVAGAVLIASWSTYRSLRYYRTGFQTYLRSVGPRILAAALLQTIATIALTDASITLIAAVSGGFYLWMFLTFSSHESRTYGQHTTQPTTV